MEHFPLGLARSQGWKWKMQMLGTGATAIQGIAARAWKFFGCRFGKSGRDRISMDRGSVVEIFGARWAEIEEGDGRDFRLRFARLLKILARCALYALRSRGSSGYRLERVFCCLFHLVFEEWREVPSFLLEEWREAFLLSRPPPDGGRPIS